MYLGIKERITQRKIETALAHYAQLATTAGLVKIDDYLYGTEADLDFKNRLVRGEIEPIISNRVENQ